MEYSSLGKLNRASISEYTVLWKVSPLQQKQMHGADQRHQQALAHGYWLSYYLAISSEYSEPEERYQQWAAG